MKDLIFFIQFLLLGELHFVFPQYSLSFARSSLEARNSQTWLPSIECNMIRHSASASAAILHYIFLIEEHGWENNQSCSVFDCNCKEIYFLFLLNTKVEEHWCSTSFYRDVYPTVLYSQCYRFMHNTRTFLRSVNMKRTRKISYILIERYTSMFSCQFSNSTFKITVLSVPGCVFF